MIQDIMPHKYDNTFSQRLPKEDDYVLTFNGNKVILNYENKEVSISKYCDIKDLLNNKDKMIYLFSIDDKGIFLNINKENSIVGRFIQKDTSIFRELKPSWMAFAGATAHQLYNWYVENKYCGKCGKAMNHSTKERAVVCEDCNNTVYPKISPAVIVGIINGDKILLTKYSGRAYKKYALIAGFTEIGETLEDTVRREVMEEVGLKVKNIRYYKNQPWAFSSSLLVGFFADLDGEDIVSLDTEELSKAEWIKREDMQKEDLDISLTREMMEVFRNNEISNEI